MPSSLELAAQKIGAPRSLVVGTSRGLGCGGSRGSRPLLSHSQSRGGAATATRSRTVLGVHGRRRVRTGFARVEILVGTFGAQ